jgi:hypothetical protein
VSRFSEHHGGVLRLWRFTRSLCARMVRIHSKDVRFTPKTDIAANCWDVCFVPKSGHQFGLELEDASTL